VDLEGGVVAVGEVWPGTDAGTSSDAQLTAKNPPNRQSTRKFHLKELNRLSARRGETLHLGIEG
jgi:hypothetical protein